MLTELVAYIFKQNAQNPIDSVVHPTFVIFSPDGQYSIDVRLTWLVFSVFKWRELLDVALGILARYSQLPPEGRNPQWRAALITISIDKLIVAYLTLGRAENPLNNSLQAT